MQSAKERVRSKLEQMVSQAISASEEDNAGDSED
jgi:hypothetical protein